jgi:hypothetical protein
MADNSIITPEYPSTKFFCTTHPATPQSEVETMTLKTGNIVNHTVALEWGAGKVLAVTPTMATIEFSDGISRKIAASHFHALQPAEAAAFSPATEIAQTKPVKKRSAAKSPKKKI